jgi:ferredoxin
LRAMLGRTLSRLTGHGIRGRPMLAPLGVRTHGSDARQMVTLNWILKDGTTLQTKDPVGMNLMRAAHLHDIELEGACEGVCACSTCHVVLEEDVYDELPEPSETEEDMLDQAFQLKPTSRLGCQVLITPELEGIIITLPKATRNFAVDGHFNKPH